MLIIDKITGDSYTATEFNQFKNESQNTIESSGSSLVGNSVQLKQAIARYVANADSYTDSGAADVYVLDPISNGGAGTNDFPSAYLELQQARFVAGNTNTGVSTVNVAGVGVVPIKKDKWTTALSSGDIETGKTYLLIYSVSNVAFDLIKISDAGLASTPRPQDVQRGMILSNGADADHDIDISIGKRADSTKAVFLENTSVLTKQIDANWTAGNNNGGFPSGLTLTADTWYHVFSIYNSTGAITDGGFDTSLTATNLLADATGYTEFIHQGWALTDVSSNIVQFVSIEIAGSGTRTTWDDNFDDISATASLTAVLNTVSAPPDSIADINVWFDDSSGSTDNYLLITETNQNDSVPSATNFTLREDNTGNGLASTAMGIRVNSSSQIRQRSNNNTTSTYKIWTKGFTDQRI